MAKIDWEFNGQDMIDGGAATPFSFKIERYKDSSTHEESLKIYIFLNGEDNGFIITSIFNLSRDIEKLKKYGVLLSAIDFRDLERLIEDNYLNLSIVSVNLAKDSRFDELIESVKERVKDDDEGDLICIPVNEFNDLVEDCGFYEYEMRALRGRLKDEGYIHTKGNRFAIPVRIKKDKVSRMVAFKKDKLGVAVPVSKKGKQSKKSGADE